MAARSAVSPMTISITAPLCDWPTTRSIRGAPAASVSKASTISITGSMVRRSTVRSIDGGISTVAMRRLTAPLRMAMPVAPTASRRSSWMFRGRSEAVEAASTTVAVSAMVSRSASQLSRKLATEGI